ncbi:MAG: AI-2E family transporter [Anaerolineae bacterium]|nr:AI-2E family transporter [Anaerolineae bacterium]
MSDELALPPIPDTEGPDPKDELEAESPLWSTNTKIIVTVIALILLVAVTLRFTNVIRIITLAAIIAYLMNPIIAFVHKRTGIGRGVSVALVYLLLVVLVGTAVTILGAATYIEATSFIQQLPVLITDITGYVENIATQSDPIVLGTFSFSPAEINWEAIGQQVLGLVEPAAGKSYQILTSVATKTVGIVGDLFFIFILSIYLAAEIPKLGGYVMRVARTPGYQHDAKRLMQSFSQVWSSYLRGQMLLGLSIGTASWFGLTVLGVQNSIALGIISGILEFVPNIGPLIAAIIAVIVAFFQTTPNTFGLTSVELTLLVLVWMIIVQQLENNLLVPRIMGNALNLHPLLVLLGVLMGASLAGILGAILAAPIIATIKLIGLYVWRKMFDLPPFETQLAPVTPRTQKPSLRERWHQWRARK